MGLYKKKDSPFWQMCYTIDGRQFHGSLKPFRIENKEDKKEAEKEWRKMQVKIDDGMKPSAKENPTMHEVIEQFLNEVSAGSASHERNISIAENFCKFFEETKLKDVTPAEILHYVTERRKQFVAKGNGKGKVKKKIILNKKISSGTVRKELGFLRQVFYQAMDIWGYCGSNPCRAVFKKHNKNLLKESKRVRYVKPDEAEKLRTEIPQTLMPIVLIAATTGLRRGNYCRLRIEDLDFKNDWLTTETSKNDEPLGVDMNETTKLVLKRVIGERKTGYVFADAEGNHVSPSAVSQAWIRACKRAGVKNLHLHDLRHDFATLMLRSSKSLTVVQHALHHKDQRQTMGYAHLLPGDLKEHYRAMDGKGTAAVLLQNYYNEENGETTKKELEAATP